MLNIAADNNKPWCSVGDYYVITNIEEKLGGVPYNMRKILEFITMIEACGLLDLGFSGQKYTLSNNKSINHRVWKRLDMALVNDNWLEKMPQTTITHLPSVGSDHCPLLFEMVAREEEHIKYFKFLSCWANHPNFLDMVKSCWERDVEGSNMWRFHQKLKRLSNTLSTWSRGEFDDIFMKVREYAERVRNAEERLIQEHTDSNRANLHELNAEYIKFLKLEDSILKQKTQLQWFREGDYNTKYFHSLIKGRRRRLFIHKLLREDGEWIQGEEDIAKAACDHFQSIFTGENKRINEGTMDCIPRMINQEQNNNRTAMPTIEELKETIPKSFSHSCIVLLRKVCNPNKFTEFRPISLSNFTSKIISKLVSSRLGPILPELVSLNQSGFVKGRSISENIMLAQEIIHQIKKPNIGSNVVIKLDMAKAYDTVSWSYICLVLRRMGFDEVFIDMIWRIMDNNAAEVLSRSLNRLHNNPEYHGFFMESRGPQVNHLSFADDVILFTSGRQKTLKKLQASLLTLIKVTSWSIIMLSTAPRKGSKESLASGRRRVLSPILAALYLLVDLESYIFLTLLTKCCAESQVQSIMENFFWGWRNEKKKYHWASWKKLSFPYDEGGVGIRNLKDVCMAFQYKQWWIFRSKQTLWGDFLKAKYCQRSNPISKKWDTGESLTWKHLMHNKQKVKEHIKWKLNLGNCSFWWDNWLGVGHLAQFSSDSNRFNNTTVAEFWVGDQWNLNMLIQQAPYSQLAIIIATELYIQMDLPDQVIWKLSNNGKFICSSSWNEIREKKTKTHFNNFTWHKSIPFKASFLLWRTIRGKLPPNEKLTSFGNEPANYFCCCNRSGQDTIEHTFNNGPFASDVWRSFVAAAGINTDHRSQPQLIMQWWSTKYNNEAHRLLLQATPILICWNLWKNRCASK
ncbi:uncharacterized protein [Solanum tuberosum]|uniref:uncharacterized protein n=1 Tax=Solanum tuberosum TaxID=4113 RepID=UPI00073A22B9|nr:PREDICTED: uncharacterized protein LOC107058509 [Solanum tuberosum]